MSTATARFTIEQYDRMIAAGVFDPPNPTHFELIQGEIRPMSPIGFRHENGVDYLMYWSVQSTDAKTVRVRVQQSIGLPAIESVPQPDLAWVAKQQYLDRPDATNVFLIIEVSDSTVDRDQNEKALLYAAAGIADYWVVNIPGGQVEVRRDPTPIGYRSTVVYQPGQSVRPLRFPNISLDVQTLFTEIGG